MANMLQYSCMENPFSDREAWQAAVYRVARSQTQRKQCYVHRCENFFACGHSTPVRVEREGGTAAWLAGTLGGTKCAGTRTVSTAGVRALSGSFFLEGVALVAGDQKPSLDSFSPYSTHSGT